MRHLTLEERLDLLRAADKERKWHSLDDERVCVVCNRVFTGRQIRIRRDQRGRFLLHCPTDDCPSCAPHWFLHRIHREPAMAAASSFVKAA